MTKSTIKQKIKKTVVSNKKKNRDKLKNEVDMLKFKKKIKLLMHQFQKNNTKSQPQIENNSLIELPDNIYYTMLQKYLKNEYTLTCSMLINKIILDTNRNHLEKYQTKYNFNKLFVSLAKELLFNEYELILLSLYLEYIDISLYLDIFSLEESLLFIFFFVKRLTITSNQLEPINTYLIKNHENFSQNFNKWLSINEQKIDGKSYFNYIEVNQRFREYNLPINVYCPNNYIDYNFIVDNILSMSLPYLDIKTETKKEEKNHTKDKYVNNKKNDKIEKNNTNKIINESINKSSKNVTNSKNDNSPNKNNNNTKNITPNSLLHSLCNRNNIISVPDINNKKLPFNTKSINNLSQHSLNPYLIDGSMKQIDEYDIKKRLSGKVLFNPIGTPSQNSFFFLGNSMGEMPLFNRSKNIDNEEENLKRILNRSSDIFFGSNLSFDSAKNMCSGIFCSNNNLNNNNNNTFNKINSDNNHFSAFNIAYNNVGNNSALGNVASSKIIYCENDNLSKNLLESSDVYDKIAKK